jgi:hypothetical protein
MKQELFMMEFDLLAACENDHELLSTILPIDHSTNDRNIMFRINGFSSNHSTGASPIAFQETTVFTDDLHYILKGNKLLKCCLE